MGLFFFGDGRQNLVAMIEEIAERVEDLCLVQSQGFHYFRDRFPAPMKSSDVSNGDAQPVNYGLATANAFVANDMRMLSLYGIGHSLSVKERNAKRTYYSQVQSKVLGVKQKSPRNAPGARSFSLKLLTGYWMTVLSNTSPPERVTRAAQVMIEMLPLTLCTDPSPNNTLTTPVWKE
jgi:hypothetical protein